MDQVAQTIIVEKNTVADLSKRVRSLADLTTVYQAKSQGRNRVVTYSPEMRRAIEQRVSLGRGMREAIASDEIVPFYQPKVNLATGEIVGLEALARWRHPSDGILTPAFFGAVLRGGARPLDCAAFDRPVRAW